VAVLSENKKFNKLSIDKPVLLIGSAPYIDEYLTPEKLEYLHLDKYFTICTGKALYALEHVDVVTCLDLIRLVHNLSNFNGRWDYFLVPHQLTKRYWDGKHSGIFEVSNTSPFSGKAPRYTVNTGAKEPTTVKDFDSIVYRYPRSPKHAKMLFHAVDFNDYLLAPGKYEGRSILHPSISYDAVDNVMDLSQYEGVVKFYREDVDLVYSAVDNFLRKDGTLRNCCSSLHFLINFLWLKNVREIHMLGITRTHSSWGYTRQLLDFYGITFYMLEDFNGEVP
tara:strand:+ start:1030 stop:1866 length:837 start_codon:yes stop_codon:yes gene_type:complete